MPEETKLNLNDPKILEALEWYAGEAARFADADAAYRIVRFLPKYLEKTPTESPDLELTYQRMILKSKFVALEKLKDEEIVELLQNNFPILFEIDFYDLWERVRAKLVVIPQYEKRDELRKKIREAVLACDQVLTAEHLDLGGKKVKGTVKNWLVDYTRTVGVGKIESLKMSEYLVNGPNTKSLKEESRKKLEYLVKFYEKIKLSSLLDYEGIEEPLIFDLEGKLVVFKDGQAEKPGRDIIELASMAKAAEQTLETKKMLEEKYRGDEKEEEKIKEEMEKINKNTAGDFKKLTDALFRAVIPRAGMMVNKIQVKAILKILAEQGKIEDLLEEKKFNDMMVSYFREKGRTVELDGFKVNPRAPQYVTAFLKHILIDRAGMSEDESGRFGMRLLNVLAKKGLDSKYQGLVYFDLKTQEFKWS